MPSPFPGMDPYLEDPVLWPGVHHGLIYRAKTDLNAVLPAGYVANVGERVYVVEPDRNVYPDVFVTEQPVPAVAGGNGPGMLLTADPALDVYVEPLVVREPYLEILAVHEQERVVTAIEFLSPSNKSPGQGREEYLRKRAQVRASHSHLVEIDLLRRGQHVSVVPVDQLLRHGHWDYVVTLLRAGAHVVSVWRFTVRQPLPRIRVPLAGQDPDVVLDLQRAFTQVYDDSAYVRRLDYRADPAVPLSREDADWADGLLREKGLRK